MSIPDTFEEAMAYFDDYVIYQPLAKRRRYLDAVMKKFEELMIAHLRQQPAPPKIRNKE